MINVSKRLLRADSLISRFSPSLYVHRRDNVITDYRSVYLYTMVSWIFGSSVIKLSLISRITLLKIHHPQVKRLH